MDLVDAVALSLLPPAARRRRNPDDRLKSLAKKTLAQAISRGIVGIAVGDPRYPPRLAAIFDPPPVLWIDGDAAALTAPAVISRAGASSS
jgi:predicted Rossmann fold nucleotide-binding protein DprA/Smf involved in DNA uptake